MAKQNHHNKILDTALTVFYEQGFHSSGVQDVVAIAGVSKGSFYNHFKSKDALGLAVLDLYWEKNADARSLLRDAKVPAIKRIDNHIKAIGYNEAGCLVGNFGNELASIELIRTRIAELLNSWADDVAACLSEGQQDGTVRHDDSAKNLADFFISSLEGAILKAKVERDPDVLKRFRKSIRLFLESR